MLLDKDGLSIEWQDDIGLFDNRDHSNVPFALRRLLSGAEQRNYDSSGMGLVMLMILMMNKMRMR